MPDRTARDRFAALAAQTKPRWNLDQPEGEASAKLHLYGAIGGWWGDIDAASIVPAIRDLDVDTIHVFVNSPGGDVYDGVAIRNALRQHSARVVVTVDGLAASAASFIAVAGDEVIMGENAELMIHDAWSIAIGNADDMRTVADDLDRLSNNIAGMYAAKAGGEPDAWRALMKAETWYSASEAVAAGLADRTDADEPATDEPAASNLFDLSMYAHAGRAAARAPIPVAALATSRKDTTEMPDTLTREQLDTALDERLDSFNADITRTIDTRLANFGGAVAAGPTWPTFGAFLKDFVRGDSAAADYYKKLAAYEGGTTTDTGQGNTWVADAIHLIAKVRRVIGQFTHETLPADGMTLEYLKLESNSLTVGKQAAQGDKLPFGKIVLDSDTASIDTYGGYTTVSRQVIDRAKTPYLNTAFRAMDIEYARSTEQAVRDLLTATITAQITAGNNLDLSATATAYDWLDLIVDAADIYDDNGYTIDGAYVSKDVFKKLLRLEDSAGNSLMRVYGAGVNQVGEVDLTGLQGNLASVTFRLLPGAAANTATFYDSLGITVWESAGAPWQLQDDDITSLTGDFSKYGYLAAASQFPAAILPIDIAAGE
jgi:ATP-dependent protease ClpP protease subunit